MHASLSAEATEVVLKAKVDARGAIVRLGDVADVRSVDDKRVASLNAIGLFPSPTPGRICVYSCRNRTDLFRPTYLAVKEDLARYSCADFSVLAGHIWPILF